MKLITKICIVIAWLLIGSLIGVIYRLLLYQGMALEMFPEIFLSYNWETLPTLTRHMIQDAVYPLIPLIDIMVVGLIGGAMFLGFVGLMILAVIYYEGDSL